MPPPLPPPPLVLGFSGTSGAFLFPFTAASTTAKGKRKAPDVPEKPKTRGGGGSGGGTASIATVGSAGESHSAHLKITASQDPVLRTYGISPTPLRWLRTLALVARLMDFFVGETCFCACFCACCLASFGACCLASFGACCLASFGGCFCACVFSCICTWAPPDLPTAVPTVLGLTSLVLLGFEGSAGESHSAHLKITASQDTVLRTDGISPTPLRWLRTLATPCVGCTVVGGRPPLLLTCHSIFQPGVDNFKIFAHDKDHRQVFLA